MVIRKHLRYLLITMIVKLPRVLTKISDLNKVLYVSDSYLIQYNLNTWEKKLKLTALIAIIKREGSQE